MIWWRRMSPRLEDMDVNIDANGDECSLYV